jgi:RNA polymerase sigma-70 factor (ECF subfamily)
VTFAAGSSGRGFYASRRTSASTSCAGSSEPATIEAPDPKAGPEELTLGAELRASLERALATLPPEQRAAVVLADVQGLSYEDVAGVLGCSVGTVKSRIFRARERLRAYLQALPEPPAPAVRPTGERSNVTGREGP